MERKKVWHATQAYGISACNSYNTFMCKLSDTRERIKELYPEVKDEDIEINISNGDYNDSIELVFEFRRFETDEEQNRRLYYEENRIKLEKEKMMNEIQSFFKLYPELKETVLNS